MLSKEIGWLDLSNDYENQYFGDFELARRNAGAPYCIKHLFRLKYNGKWSRGQPVDVVKKLSRIGRLELLVIDMVLRCNF